MSVINPLAVLEEQRHLDFEVRAFKPAITVRLALLLAPDAPHSRLASAFKDVVRGVIESELDHIRAYRS